MLRRIGGVLALVPLISGIAVTLAGRADARPITLGWVGDIALSSERGLPPGGLGSALGPLRSLLSRADLMVGNLEGTLSRSTDSKCGGIGGGSCYAFQAPASIANQLATLGFDVVNQANNHSLDYGPTGRAETIAALRRAHLAYTGLPGQITVMRVKRHRVAFVGFAPYPYDANLLNIPAARRLIRRAHRIARVVVVLIHAGGEGANELHTPHGSERYLGEDRGNPRAFAHAAIDAGASLVLGSGPHVLRGIERYGGHLIAYSLGNFVGYHTLAGGGVLSESGILHVVLSANGHLLAAKWSPILLAEGLPHLDRSRASTKLIAALSRTDFPGHRFRIHSNGAFELTTPPTATS